MTTTKLDRSGVFGTVSTSSSQETCFMLPVNGVAFRKNGIEFLSPERVDLWKELTVELCSPIDQRPLRGTGVVVDCTGNRHTGYVVSLMFIHLPTDARQHLEQLARAGL